MPLKLMYITNLPEVAKIAQSVGVDRIFVDMEYIGKHLRQGGMDTVQSRHTIEDVRRIAAVLSASELLVRINPMHEKTDEYPSSREEIDAVIVAGADILMLPYFKTADEVKQFVSLVGGRVRTMLLVETPEAAERIDEILAVDGVDEIFVGLNDLSLGYGRRFMFELLTDGTVERLVEKFQAKGIPFGFGGLASLEGGLLPGKMVIGEHYRLGSGCVILSRSFCNIAKTSGLAEVKDIFVQGVGAIRAHEAVCRLATPAELTENRKNVVLAVEKIVERIMSEA